MAKKSRRERKAEASTAPTAPRVPTSTAVMPTTGAATQTLTASSAPVARPPTAPAPNRTSRTSRTTVDATADAPARIPRKEMVQEWVYVRKDLRHILILAVILFGSLVVLSLLLPRMLGY